MTQFPIRSFLFALLGTALVWGAWVFTREGGRPAAVSAAAAPLSPADARQQEILNANKGKPGDPDLMAQYAAINARHFGGALSPIAVRWEPRLADVGPLSGQDVALQGMFGRVGVDGIILLNPSVRADPRARERALCHEMVHAYLFAIGDLTTGHGPAFQSVLKRLSTEGAFEGIAAQAEEKARLKAWLDAESARIDQERRDMAVLDTEIKLSGTDIDREIAAFNARAERPAAEADALEARRAQFNARLLEANVRLDRGREDLAHFNREVARYNLMTAYPDGLDEQALVPSKR